MLSFLFPPICPLCAKELLDKGEHICKICSKKQIFIKEPTCYSCGKSMKNQEKEYCSDCRQHPKNFERGMGLCIYQKPVTDSLAAIKYKNERKFAQYYLEEIRKRKYRELLRLKADAVIPVPIHKKKRRKRGFNQAEIFAKGIAEMLNQPMYTKIAKRVLVIDDIYTTGSTAEAVTTALKQLGVQEVYVFCIAIGKGFS